MNASSPYRRYLPPFSCSKYLLSCICRRQTDQWQKFRVLKDFSTLSTEVHRDIETYPYCQHILVQVVLKKPWST